MGWKQAGLAALCLGSAGVPAMADLSVRGGSGVIDMPDATPLPDGTLAFSLSHLGGVSRSAITFQIAPRLQGTFRYSSFKIPLNAPGIETYGPGSRYFDRAFDLRFLLMREEGWWPSVTVGLQDFAGTGMDGGEFIALSRQFSPRLRATAGLGWGSYGGRHALFSTGTRAQERADLEGGTPNFKQWFRGDAAAFAGISWQATDRFRLKAEWSSDAYREISGRQGVFKAKSGLNLGVEYLAMKNLTLGVYSLGGREFGFAAQIPLNLRERGPLGFGGPVPRPIQRRAPGPWSQDWLKGGQVAAVEAIKTPLTAQLAEDGLSPISLDVQGNWAELRFRNSTIDNPARAFGRSARAMASHLPASVETFDLVLISLGMPTARLRVNRAELEALETAYDGSGKLAQSIQFAEGQAAQPGALNIDASSPLSWSVSPFLRMSYFDPDKPLRLDTGFRFRGDWQLAPGLYLSGSYTHRLVGNMKKVKRPSNSVLPHVRTDDYLRDRRAGRLELLTLSWFEKPREDLYTRLTFGLLEKGYGGVSGEVLWKPSASRLGLGAELNALRQRSLHRLTGFEHYQVVTGQVSAWYEFKNGFIGQLSAGRYLAGDLGATLSLEREFANGWRVGAFATLTNVSRRDFGEGSFDKGILLTIPLGTLAGSDRRNLRSETLRLVQRDGGAQVEVPWRLYEVVREAHAARLSQQWGQVWR